MSTGCTYGRDVGKHAFVKSMARQVCQKQKLCLPSLQMALAMLRNDKVHSVMCTFLYCDGSVLNSCRNNELLIGESAVSITSLSRKLFYPHI
jgi:hypothetical protein